MELDRLFTEGNKIFEQSEFLCGQIGEMNNKELAGEIVKRVNDYPLACERIQVLTKVKDDFENQVEELQEELKEAIVNEEELADLNEYLTNENIALRKRNENQKINVRTFIKENKELEETVERQGMKIVKLVEENNELLKEIKRAIGLISKGSDGNALFFLKETLEKAEGLNDEKVLY